MHYLTSSVQFPDVSEADSNGLLAIGGDLSVERLLLAYNSGIFPWYEEGQPILWWSPNKRLVLFLDKFKVSKSLQTTIKSKKYRVSYNTAFSQVIENCSAIKREGQAGTWITTRMQQAYLKLHELGFANSVEVWYETELVGGLYGIDLPEKRIFCGESMFHKKSDASKVGFYHLISELIKREYRFIDCQLYTVHLASLGAEEISRKEFSQLLRE